LEILKYGPKYIRFDKITLFAFPPLFLKREGAGGEFLGAALLIIVRF
jgi:hypothetical protein